MSSSRPAKAASVRAPACAVIDEAPAARRTCSAPSPGRGSASSHATPPEALQKDSAAVLAPADADSATTSGGVASRVVTVAVARATLPDSSATAA